MASTQPAHALVTFPNRNQKKRWLTKGRQVRRHVVIAPPEYDPTTGLFFPYAGVFLLFA
jgi:hypothetical protein